MAVAEATHHSAQKNAHSHQGGGGARDARQPAGTDDATLRGRGRASRRAPRGDAPPLTVDAPPLTVPVFAAVPDGAVDSAVKKKEEAEKKEEEAKKRKLEERRRRQELTQKFLELLDIPEERRSAQTGVQDPCAVRAGGEERRRGRSRFFFFLRGGGQGGRGADRGDRFE